MQYSLYVKYVIVVKILTEMSKYLNLILIIKY